MAADLVAPVAAEILTRGQGVSREAVGGKVAIDIQLRLMDVADRAAVLACWADIAADLPIVLSIREVIEVLVLGQLKEIGSRRRAQIGHVIRAARQERSAGSRIIICGVRTAGDPARTGWSGRSNGDEDRAPCGRRGKVESGRRARRDSGAVGHAYAGTRKGECTV